MTAPLLFKNIQHIPTSRHLLLVFLLLWRLLPQSSSGLFLSFPTGGCSSVILPAMSIWIILCEVACIKHPLTLALLFLWWYFIIILYIRYHHLIYYNVIYLSIYIFIFLFYPSIAPGYKLYRDLVLSPGDFSVPKQYLHINRCSKNNS